MVWGGWFGTRQSASKGDGLTVSLEELADMRRYAAYVRGWQHNRDFSLQSGDIKSAFKGRGMEFEEIRSYNYGDDVRDIDWRVTARKDTPYTKVYAEEKDREVYAWLDLSAPMLFGSQKELKSVTAAKLTALLGWLALENKDRFGCVMFDGRSSRVFRPQNNRAQLLAIFKKLAELSREVLQNPAAEDGAVVKSLKLLEQNARNKATVFLLGDFAAVDDALWRQMAVLARRSRLYVVNIFDRLEEEPPQAGEYMAEYGGKRLIFDSSAAPYRDEYRAYFAAGREKLRAFCRKFGWLRFGRIWIFHII